MYSSALTMEAQAVYDELNSRKGILDGIDDDALVHEICTAVADAVMAAHCGA